MITQFKLFENKSFESRNKYGYSTYSFKIKKGDIYRVDHSCGKTICEIVKKERPTIEEPAGVCRFEGFYLPYYKCDDIYKFRELTSTVINSNDVYMKATKEEKELYYELRKNYEKKLVQNRFDL